MTARVYRFIAPSDSPVAAFEEQRAVIQQWRDTRLLDAEELEIATPQSFRCIPIRSDYQPRPPRTWAAQAYDGAQSACAFAALGFVGGVMATVSVMLQVMAGWR